MRIFSFTGRVLLSALFIFSGVSKFTSLQEDGRSTMLPFVTEKCDCFLTNVAGSVPFDLPLKPIQEHYHDLILVAGAMEVAGGLLFILDFSFGAILLMLFLIGVTPVMHNFWWSACNGGEPVTEMISFMKNLSIFGGLLAYISKVGKYQKFKME